MEHGHIDNEFDLTLGHYVEMCSKLGIIVDFDGTLSPLARTPELAFIPPETKKVWLQDSLSWDNFYLDNFYSKIGVKIPILTFSGPTNFSFSDWDSISSASTMLLRFKNFARDYIGSIPNVNHGN